MGCRTMASCVFRRFPPCFCRAFPVEWKTNSSQFAFLENAVGVSRPEVLPNKQRGPSPGVFPRLGPFLYSTPFFFISNVERWLPVFRKFFACFCRERRRREKVLRARRRRERHYVPAFREMPPTRPDNRLTHDWSIFRIFTCNSTSLL